MSGNWQSLNDFGFHESDLDGRYAAEYFSGLDREQAQRKFLADPSRYLEYLMRVSGDPFRFYFGVVICSMRETPLSILGSKAVSEFLGWVSWKMSLDLLDIVPFASDILIICDLVSKWDVTEQYENYVAYRIPKKVDRLRSVLKNL